jgi:hypothetical protein
MKHFSPRQILSILRWRLTLKYEVTFFFYHQILITTGTAQQTLLYFPSIKFHKISLAVYELPHAYRQKDGMTSTEASKLKMVHLLLTVCFIEMFNTRDQLVLSRRTTITQPFQLRVLVNNRILPPIFNADSVLTE